MKPKKKSDGKSKIQTAIKLDRQTSMKTFILSTATKPVWNYSLFTDEDISNFQNGTHYTLVQFFWLAEKLKYWASKGFYFAVWAPNASYISVIGNFNDWNQTAHPLLCDWKNPGSGKDSFRSFKWEKFINIISLDLKE